MTLEELIAAAGHIDRALTERVHVWHVIVAVGPDGGPVETGERIYSGSFYRQRDSHISEPHFQGEKL